MAGVPKSWKTVEIRQQTRFGFEPEKLKEVLDNWSVVKDYAFILHDKDVKDDGSLKEPHIHCMVRFNGAVPTTAILAKFKDIITANELRKCKIWRGAVAYLTHANDKGKYQYSDDEVVSNYDWTVDRDEAVAYHSTKVSAERKAEIRDKIASGEYPIYKLSQYVSVHEYCACSMDINKASEYFMKVCGGVNKDMDVIFITGVSGAGKTTYAKMICEGRGFEPYISSGGKNPLDDYQGQPAIILDDLRGSTMPLADLLKLLDNNTASLAGARFYNRNISPCKLMIITSIDPIDQFFRKVFESENEPLTQLKRRCATYLKMTKGSIDLHQYVKELRDYALVTTIPNPVSVMYGNPNASQEEREDELLRVLGGCADGVKEAIEFERARRSGAITADGQMRMPEERIDADHHYKAYSGFRPAVDEECPWN